ncbi:protein-tyrosine phosphatase domain-containing protein [Ditylenchus destructor]|uniref:Protein-tyrosine phosphatase domain-containing protein n=1 Tax=Ditylenchus destructor TaxID=166010 RepID=A0AAD4NAI7_9BILA|nr:protein-tyrosine phosphatase domain-containing protein [Ditylenchus destructor]
MAQIDVMRSYLDYFDHENTVTKFADITNEFEEMWQDFSDVLNGSDKNKFKMDVAERNSARNRYWSIGPYDSNRIHLNGTGATNPDGYINASPISYPGTTQKYIAAMGPIEKTVPDFWDMILQQHVLVIAMLCKSVERGMSKCATYWPQNLEERLRFKTVAHGEFIITLTDIVDHDDFLVRRFAIHHNATERIVHQLHYNDWPDHGRPNVAQKVATFIETLHSLLPDRSRQNADSPILVHCSAGCGRTGTVIAINILREIIKTRKGEHPLLSRPLQRSGVRQFVLDLRRQRINLLEDAGQYRLLHRCLAIYSREVVNDHIEL